MSGHRTCSHAGCTRAVFIVTNMTPFCWEHWAKLCEGVWFS
jgi:hypothetical protein